MATQTASPLLRVTCPAGDPLSETRGLNGPGCHCRIAKEIISARQNPSTLDSFCTADYTQCPVWRRHRDEWFADQHRKLQREIDAAAPSKDL